MTLFVFELAWLRECKQCQDLDIQGNVISPALIFNIASFPENIPIETGYSEFRRVPHQLSSIYPARALRALGLLLAEGTPRVGGGKTF